MTDVSYAMEDTAKKSGRHRKRGLKTKGEGSASRTVRFSSLLGVNYR